MIGPKILKGVSLVKLISESLNYYLNIIFKLPSALYYWTKESLTPDEFYWATLNRYFKIPGYSHQHEKYHTNEFQALAKFVKWADFCGSKEEINKGLAAYPHCMGSFRKRLLNLTTMLSELIL